MSDLRRRVQRLEEVGEGRRPIIHVRWSEDVAADDGEDDEDVELIRLAWKLPR